MNKLALAFALGAATLFSGSAVNAADAGATPDSAINASAVADGSQAAATDVSSRHRRHWRHRHWHRWHHHHGYYRPYYRSYGYYPGYYNPGPVISFGFGGGPRFHHRHW